MVLTAIAPLPLLYLQCLPPGGRGTTKWWKEQAGTKAEQIALLRADMESAPTENSQAAGGASPSPTVI